MPSRRSYRQHCGVARALDLVGERWTLLVVRDLLLGPRQYGDLLASLDGITTNLLAKRLQELSAAGLVEKVESSVRGARPAYALTGAGRALEPVVNELGRWGGRLLAEPRRGDRRDIGWALLSMRRRYRGGSSLVAEVVAGARRFEIVLSPERMQVQEKPSERATVRALAGTQDAFFELFFLGGSTRDLERQGRLVIEGDREAWATLQAAFAPPALPTARKKGASRARSIHEPRGL
jgi:DNA-binding HxlR family transcriptional regulator